MSGPSWRVLAAVPVLLAAACGPLTASPPPTSPAPSQAASPPASPASPGASAAGYALPDRALTPGAAGSDITQICPHVSSALEAARPSTATKARVYAAYRIPITQRHLYVIDHDDPLQLDGENVIANLWPQPVAQAHVKDGVEAALHAAVCSHRVTLARAQAAITANWATAERVLGLAP